MDIYVTKHCVEQFKNRTFGQCYESDEEVVGIITRAIRKNAMVVRKRPGDAYEISVKIDGETHYFVILKGEELKVITYLGNRAYKTWVNKHEIRPRYAGGKYVRPRYENIGLPLC